MSRWTGRWPTDGIAFGADYNPEQWPQEVWAEDVSLMREAGVNLVSLGIFSWGQLEPEEGRFEFEWLDRILDLLHEAGIGVDLATPSAAPPVWLHLAHPEMLPVDADGLRFTHGSRESWCVSSPVIRAHATRVARVLAERYGHHPAVRMWHVSNELACHNGRCYCDVSAAAFRDWLGKEYPDVDALNLAWGTAFWGQRYTSFEQILPPRRTTTIPNPGQRLDYDRFSSDAFVAHLEAEAAVLREVTPHLPVTTNYMVMGDFHQLDYQATTPLVDIVSNDHYLWAEDPRGWAELAFSADRVRGLAGGKPWILMEHSTSAVNWQPRNLAKEPGQMLRNSLQHVARGSDGVLFFQWRQSRAGAEKYHSGMVPHAGRDSDVFREVVDLGGVLGRLAEVRGSVVAPARVALLWDTQAWWATDLEAHPSVDVQYLDVARDLHGALLDAGVAVDVLPASSSLDGYDVVLVPTLYLAPDGLSARLSSVVERGGQVLVTYFSGIVDHADRVILGGYPGAFRDLLGVRVEEFAPLAADGAVTLSDGGAGLVWSERLTAPGAEVLTTFVDGPSAGRPALTRRDVDGGGGAWYLATRLDAPSVAALLDQVLSAAGVAPVVPSPGGLDVVRRTSQDGSWLFAINHTDADVPLHATGTDLVRSAPHASGDVVPARGAVVLREID
ncbi:beta-galactosidase [Cellulomonas chitinilytica]|uniref:Beta-galactosidase n=1 Tax=Cellulomonas chitinilytica TaxID=398759 RepID=A0A919U3G0_9CELL|nr:beta-galactosidase [Cellulomonas chitinilytica]GIG23271.1 beta-galactosidase [Cellulomonas chitinilytica]